MKIIETPLSSVLTRNSVFKDMSVLDYGYQPPVSPIRKEVLEKLCRIFEPVLTSYTPQFVVIHGPVGTGKTELVKRFSVLFKENAFENGTNIHFEFINCRRGYTNSAVMMKILNHFRPNFRDMGYSINEMFKMLSKHLENQNVHIIVVLDEAEILIEKNGSKLISQLSTFSEKGSLSIILISQKNVADMLAPSLLDTFKRENIIHLNRFKQEEILAVVNQRIKLAFHKGVVEMGVVGLISDIAGEWGDVRYAIELLEKSGMIAVEQNAEKVTVEHVRAAKAETYSTITEDMFKTLDQHQKLILLAISRCLKAKAYTTIGEVEMSYCKVCKEFGEKQLIQSEYLKSINDLASSGFIDIREAKSEDSDKMRISLYDIPTTLIEAKLTEFY